MTALLLTLALAQTPPGEPNWQWLPDGDGDYAVWCGTEFKGWHLKNKGFYRWNGKGYDPVDDKAGVGPKAGDDDALFARLRERIDKRVDDRVAAAVSGAADEAEGKREGGGVILAAVVRLVTAVLKGLVVAAVVTVFLAYWPRIVLGFVVAVVLIAWPVASVVARRSKP